MRKEDIYNKNSTSLRVGVPSNHRPPTTEVDDVPAESFIPISISNRGIDIVVHQNPSMHGVVVNALSTWPIDIAV